jgi:hypothetical protein
VKAILPDELAVDVADARVKRKGRRDVVPVVIGASGCEHGISVDGVAVAPDRKIGALLQGSRENAGNSSNGANSEDE